MWRTIRAVTKSWPFLPGAAVLNRVVEPLVGGCREHWEISEEIGRCPALILNVTNRLQRKTFLFPRVYANYYLNKPLGQLMLQLLRPGDTFVDIGANVGFYTLHAARLVGAQGRVVAVEADPATCDALSRSATYNRFDHVRVVNAGLSDRCGESTFHIDPNGLASSLVPDSSPDSGRYSASKRIETTTFDALADRESIDLVRLIKVDVEGEEVRTIAGMRDTLARIGRPPVWCEVRGPAGSRRAPNTYAKVRALLHPLGYRSFRAEDGRSALTPADLRRRGSFDVLFATSNVDGAGSWPGRIRTGTSA